ATPAAVGSSKLGVSQHNRVPLGPLASSLAVLSLSHLEGFADYKKHRTRCTFFGTIKFSLIRADRLDVSEKRIEQRIPLMARVDILWMDNELTPWIAPAILEDRSRGGVSLRMKNAVQVGAHVTVKSGMLQYSGIVMNCRRDNGTYITGIKLDPREEPEDK
ncbi:MAG TPA: hypothetical protein VG272_06280, partial [Candidatus Acidoferrales bacterium]|nr:hypothetical protein [Candidatus Acidoferrales bacterium]